MDTKDIIDLNTEGNKNFPEDTGGKKNKNKNKKKNKKNKLKGHLIRSAVALVVLVILYLTAVYSDIPFIEKWRTIYIETAMSTNSHQWLATYFIPKSVVDEVVDKKNAALEKQKQLESKWETQETEETETVTPEELFYQKYWELDTYAFKNYLSEHSYLTVNDYKQVLIEDFDEELGLVTKNGDPILVVDTANNLLVIGIHGSNFEGKLAIIKDPAQVELAKAESLGRFGEEVSTFGERYDAAIAINASGFTDVGGHGTGADVKGALIIDGVEYSTTPSSWKFYGMKFDNKLYVGNYSDIDPADYRWGIQFFPALIVNGECVVDGTLGMGIQPRTAIGQAEDGTFMMLIVDGRQVGYSLGCTVQDCSDILMSYGAVQAGNLDGGSSSVMWYKGQQITKSSSATGRGRYMPDALIVRKVGQ